MPDLDRDLWLPEFSARVIELSGHDWPDVLVERWEVNRLGERRFVSSKLYSPFGARHIEAPSEVLEPVR